MPLYRVAERADAVRVYKVEADTPEEAAMVVEEGNVDFYNEMYIDFCVHEVVEVKE